jgi:Asp-tRNA(Asn)/Glu-tRNA(Gln) amidotransferase A subunit family amidase
MILIAEAAAAFDEMTRSNQDDLLAWQHRDAWPNTFRAARFFPAVEYVNANRIRVRLMQEMAGIMEKIDVFVTPSYGEQVLTITNLTGHPAVVLPNGFKANGSPVSISFIGGLDQEAETLAVAKAYQDATNFHLQHPKMNY